MASTNSYGNYMDYTPGSAVAVGDVVVLGSIVAVAPRPIAANELGSVAVEGVFDVAKATGAGTTIAQGDKVYWYPTGSHVVTGSTGTAMGFATEAATADDTSVKVKLVHLS